MLKKFLKKFTKRFLLKKAGRAQLVGIIAAIIGGTALGQANPGLVKVIREGGPALIASVVAFVGFVIAAVDTDKVLDATVKENK